MLYSIIAISGIDGHAYGSWRGKGNLGRMWLRDFLSKDMPRCRTMIYGYNAKLSSRGIDTILDYSRGFLEEIKNIRQGIEVRYLYDRTPPRLSLILVSVINPQKFIDLKVIMGCCMFRDC